MQVEPMRTASGGYAANQFRIWTDDGVTFQSYRSQIATKAYDGTTTLYAPYWDMYSTTTNRYLLQFLNEDSIRDIRVKVKLGIYLTE
jgi:hypothetical protein